VPFGFVFCALLSLVAWPAAAADGPTATPSPSGPRPSISVLTFGPGDQAFSKFGHDALWVHDPRKPPSRQDLVFNYGTFRFDSPWLIMDFLKGRLSYWLSVSTLERTLASYKAQNRSVSAQELALTDDQIQAVSAFLSKNVKPENAYYRYDYYQDNCATRIRDVLDRHLGGQLGAASQGPAPLTYRDHTRRLTVDAPILFLALDLALGRLVDRPITEWEELFLPARVEAKLSQLTTASGAPLVQRRVSLFEADRAAPLDGALGFRWGWLAAGIALGATWLALARLERRWARVSLAASLSGLGFVYGLLGALLLVLWLLTDHEVTYWNQNVLLCPVWAMALPVLARDLARAVPRRPGLMMRLVGAATACALLALLLRALPSSQHTGPALSFFVPQWLGAGGALWLRVGRPLPRWLLLGRQGTDASIPPARTPPA
jgi:hypothetical protein